MPNPKPPAERFWAHVDKTETCWLWTGAATPDGYGRFNPDAVTHGYAHRFSYELHTGDTIPPGMHIDHLCEVKNCVRPEHLKLATPRENILRSQGPAALNARKTHCINGHEFDTNASGARVCRICHRARAAARWRAKRAAPANA